MFRVLMGKMVEKDLSYEQVAAAAGISERVLRQCVNGEREFRLSEVVKIKRYVAPEMTIDELFRPKTDAGTKSEEES